MMKRTRHVLGLGCWTLVAASVLMFISCQKSESGAKSYEFATVQRGSIENTVSSSGTLAVVSSVSVLAQMSGRIETVKVNNNDHVKKGEVLATINTDLLKLQAESAQASVSKAKATFNLQTIAADNARSLFQKNLLSDFDYKTALATLEINRADLRQAQVAYQQIETEITQYALITAPIDGIVLERDIDPGQSVVGGATSTSTSLFTIAGDLSQMQINAEVDELDISSITNGQKVAFSVEAYPSETFEGTVQLIRLVPETSDSVVYYYVIIMAQNPTGKLLPGMTANVNFIVQKKDDILVVPNAALRFTPTNLSAKEILRLKFEASLEHRSAADKAAALARFDAEQAKKSTSSKGTSPRNSGLSGLMGGTHIRGAGLGGPPGGFNRDRSSTGKASGDKSAPRHAERKALWYLDSSGKLAVAMVKVGISDANQTEVSGGENLEGLSVIDKIKVQ